MRKRKYKNRYNVCNLSRGMANEDRRRNHETAVITVLKRRTVSKIGKNDRTTSYRINEPRKRQETTMEGWSKQGHQRTRSRTG